MACVSVVCVFQELADLKAQLLHLQDRSKHIRVNADMRDVKLRAELTRLEVCLARRVCVSFSSRPGLLHLFIAPLAPQMGT